MLVGRRDAASGQTGDIYGKKRVLIYVMSVYLVALLGSGFSIDISTALFGRADISVLLFFRALQGVGMGMFTLSFGIVRDTFPRDKIPVAIGMISAMFSVGVAVGLVIGGYITSVARWSDAFHVVLPFFFVLTVAASYLVPDTRIVHGGRLDLPGAFTLGASVTALLLALTQGESWGWGDPATLALFATFARPSPRSSPSWGGDPIMRRRCSRTAGPRRERRRAVRRNFCSWSTRPFRTSWRRRRRRFGLADTFTVGLYMLQRRRQLFIGPFGGSLSRKMGASNVLALGMGIMTMVSSPWCSSTRTGS